MHKQKNVFIFVTGFYILCPAANRRDISKIFRRRPTYWYLIIFSRHKIISINNTFLCKLIPINFDNHHYIRSWRLIFYFRILSRRIIRIKIRWQFVQRKNCLHQCLFGKNNAPYFRKGHNLQMGFLLKVLPSHHIFIRNFFIRCYPRTYHLGNHIIHFTLLFVNSLVSHFSLFFPCYQSFQIVFCITYHLSLFYLH